MICRSHGSLEPTQYYTCKNGRKLCKQCASLRRAKIYASDPEKWNRTVSTWRKANRDKDRVHQRRYEAKDPDRWLKHRRDKENERSKARRLSILMHYSGGNPKCACPGCQITTIQFLTVDHINNDGHEHRKTAGSGTPFYRWIVKNNFPPGFQILCWNCNSCKGIYGKCTFHGE